MHLQKVVKYTCTSQDHYYHFNPRWAVKVACTISTWTFYKVHRSTERTKNHLSIIDYCKKSAHAQLHIIMYEETWGEQALDKQYTNVACIHIPTCARSVYTQYIYVSRWDGSAVELNQINLVLGIIKVCNYAYVYRYPGDEAWILLFVVCSHTSSRTKYVMLLGIVS